MHRTITIFFIGIFLVGLEQAFATDKLVIAVDNGYPPYMYGSIKSPQGLYPKQIQALFERLKQPVEVKALPWKRALKAGEKGDAAVGGIYKNKKRLEIYDYSQPIFEEILVVYVKKGNAFDFKEMDDLAGKTVGLNLGWSYGNVIDQARKNGVFTAEEANNNSLNFKKLIRGRVDCIIIDKIAASQIVHHEKLSDKVEMLEYPASINRAYIAFSKKSDRSNLIKKINRELFKMKADGSYNRVVSEFIKSDDMFNAADVAIQN